MIATINTTNIILTPLIPVFTTLAAFLFSFTIFLLDSSSLKSLFSSLLSELDLSLSSVFNSGDFTFFSSIVTV